MFVYKMFNIETKDVYVGSTNDVEKRWKRHLYSLKKGNHHSIVLQRAWDKYGKDSFTIEIDSTHNSRKSALLREQYLINSLCPKYNISTTVFEVYRKDTPVIQCNLSEDFIAEWTSALEASKALGLNASDIIQCCKGRKYRVGKYYFKYKNNPIVRKAKLSKTDIINRNKQNSAKKYVVTFPDGSELVIKGLKKFCEENGLYYPSAHQVVLGTRGRKSHKGFKFRKYEKT